MHLHRIALAVAIAFPVSLPIVVLAQGVATEAQLQSVQISSARAPLDPNLPSSTASRTAEQLREQTIYNPEDIAVNLPSTTIRKRYFGGRAQLWHPAAGPRPGVPGWLPDFQFSGPL